MKASMCCRMTEIQELAGLGTPSEDLLELLSKEDFNEEEYDKAMAKAFDNNYYEVVTAAPNARNPL